MKVLSAANHLPRCFPATQIYCKFAVYSASLPSQDIRAKQILDERKALEKTEERARRIAKRSSGAHAGDTRDPRVALIPSQPVGADPDPDPDPANPNRTPSPPKRSGSVAEAFSTANSGIAA
jgi:hypothetical protein